MQSSSVENATILSNEEGEAQNQNDLIGKLRERIATDLPPEMDSDNFLRKWLVARNFDVDRAEEMWRKHLTFWKANGLDKIDHDYEPPKVTDYFHTVHLGYDNVGSVVRLLHLGASDLRGLTQSLSKIDAIRFAAYIIYSDSKKQRKDRENMALCEKCVYIFDLQGLSWTSVLNRTVMDRAYTLLRNYEANFPENLKIVYIINAPSFFNFIYNWLKTCLPSSIISKVNVIMPENCKEILSKIIDPSKLPASVGGLKIDENGDKNCPSLYKFPLNVSVPESYLLSNLMGMLNSDPKAKRHTINNGSSLTIKVDIERPNMMLEWDFETTFYDISFGLNYRETDSAPSREIIPSHRVESHRIPESGNFRCPDPGVYEVVFDNSYSWMTRKDIIYKISVKNPESTE